MSAHDESFEQEQHERALRLKSLAGQILSGALADPRTLDLWDEQRVEKAAVLAVDFAEAVDEIVGNRIWGVWSASPEVK